MLRLIKQTIAEKEQHTALSHLLLQVRTTFSSCGPHSGPVIPTIFFALTSNSTTVTELFKFLGTTVSKDLKRDININSITKKAQQRMFFLRQLKKLNLPLAVLIQFYTAYTACLLQCRKKRTSEAAIQHFLSQEYHRLQATAQ